MFQALNMKLKVSAVLTRTSHFITSHYLQSTFFCFVPIVILSLYVIVVKVKIYDIAVLHDDIRKTKLLLYKNYIKTEDDTLYLG